MTLQELREWSKLSKDEQQALAVARPQQVPPSPGLERLKVLIAKINSRKEVQP